MVNFHPFNHCCRVTSDQNSLDGVQLSLRGWNFVEGSMSSVWKCCLNLKHHTYKETQEWSTRDLMQKDEKRGMQWKRGGGAGGGEML